MPVKWIKTVFPGVRYYEHPTRKISIGAVKVLDKYFAIRYQADGTRTEEGLGWSSDPAKWTSEKAFAKLSALKEAAKESHDAPTRLAEERTRKAKEKRRRKEEELSQEEERKRKTIENISVEKYFNGTYLPTVKTHRKNSGYLHDEGHFSLWLAPLIGSKPIRDVSAFDLERVKKNMQAAGKAPRTIQYVFATFRQIWNMARRDKIVSEDSPTRSVKLPKFDNRRDRFLTREEADTLLNALKARDLTVYYMAALSIYTGMRASEIFRLTWRDIDFDREVIRVADPKNSESRYAFITAPVKVILKEIIVGEPDQSLFSQRDTSLYKEIPDSFNEAVVAQQLNDGVTDRRRLVCFHTMRHTFGSWLAESGVDLYTISKLLGQKTLSMAARYAHLGDGTLKSAAKKLEAIETESANIEQLGDKGQ